MPTGNLTNCCATSPAIRSAPTPTSPTHPPTPHTTRTTLTHSAQHLHNARKPNQEAVRRQALGLARRWSAPAFMAAKKISSALSCHRLEVIDCLYFATYAPDAGGASLRFILVQSNLVPGYFLSSKPSIFDLLALHFSSVFTFFCAK